MIYGTVNARKARNNFSDILKTAQEKGSIIITKFNRPVVVVTSYQEFNPQKTMDKTEWEKGFLVMDKLRQKTPSLSEKKAIKIVEEVLHEINS